MFSTLRQRSFLYVYARIRVFSGYRILTTIFNAPASLAEKFCHISFSTSFSSWYSNRSVMHVCLSVPPDDNFELNDLAVVIYFNLIYK